MNNFADILKICARYIYVVTEYSRLFVIILVCIYPALISGNESRYNVVHYTVEDGLSSNTIYGIYQDRLGYMWFCTISGLDRFDGYEFHKYKYIPGDSTSLSSGWVWAALEDHLGNFWVATGNGLNLFNRNTESFTNFDL